MFTHDTTPPASTPLPKPPKTGSHAPPAMTTPTPPRLEEIVRSALDAFWSAVVRKFPDSTTGDLSPLTTFHLDEAAEAAISEWIEANVDEGRA